MKSTTIGTWWKEVKKSLDEVKRTYPAFARESKQFKHLYEASVSGSYLDGGWAVTEGPKVKKAMARLTNDLPSFEGNKKQPEYEQGSIALLKSFKGHLENYRYVEYSEAMKELARKFAGEELNATFPKNAKGAELLAELIQKIEGHGQAFNPIVVEEKKSITTITTITTITEITEIVTSSLINFEPKQSEKVEVESKTPREKMQYGDENIGVYNKYFYKLIKIINEQGADLDSRSLDHLQNEIQTASANLETFYEEKETAVKELVDATAKILTQRVVSTAKGYLRLDQNSQAKVKELLTAVFSGEDFVEYLTNLANVKNQREYEQRLDEIVDTVRSKVEAAVYTKLGIDRGNGIYLQGYGRVAALFAAGNLLNKDGLEKAILGREKAILGSQAASSSYSFG